MSIDSSNGPPDHGSSSWNPALRPDTDATNDKSQQVPYTNGTSEQELNGARPSSLSYVSTDEHTQQERQQLPSQHAKPPALADSLTHIATGTSYPAETIEGGPTNRTEIEKPVILAPYSNGNQHADPASGPNTSLQTEAPLNRECPAQDAVFSSKGANGRNIHEAQETEDALSSRGEMEQAWRSEEKYGYSGVSAAMNRTNSFPEVPSLPPPAELLPHALPKSQQVEDLVEEKRTGDSIGALANPPSAIDESDLQSIHPFATVPDGDDDDFFTNAIGAKLSPNVTSPADEEARFEEGLPLVSATNEHNNMNQTVPEQSAADLHLNDNTSSADSEDGFFDQSTSAKDESSFRPQPFDRKTTTEILESMNYAPHDATHVSPEAIEEKPTLADLTGGDIAVSRETVKSQVFADEGRKTTGLISKDDDLAEMWKAALGDDDLLEDNDLSVDPTSFFEDDGEGFLEADPVEEAGEKADQMSLLSPALKPVYGQTGNMQGFEKADRGQATSQIRYLPAQASQTSPKTPPGYFQPQPTGTMVPQFSHVSSPKSSLPTSMNSTNSSQYNYATEPRHVRPSLPESTQSFANKAKGGYTSPYDLPMDVTRPKRRAHFQPALSNPVTQPPTSRPPPPRSSSMFAGAPPQLNSQPLVPELPGLAPNTSTGSAPLSVLKGSPSSGSFFEELPSTKPRPSTSSGRFVPLLPQATPPPPIAPQRSISMQPPIDHNQPRAPAASQQYQLLPPARLSLYEHTSQQLSQQPVPVMNSRYSPAPPPQPNVQPPPNRYVSASVGSYQSTSMQSLPHQPRTSSPLAHSTTTPHRHQMNPRYSTDSGRRSSAGYQAPGISDSPSSRFPFPQGIVQLSPDNDRTENLLRRRNINPLSEPPPPVHSSESMPNAVLANSTSARYSPQSNVQVSDGPASQSLHQDKSMYSSDTHDIPLRRSQTQSPSAGKPRLEAALDFQTPYQRPASVNHNILSHSAEETNRVPAQHFSSGPKDIMPAFEYIRPNDGRETDPLERWKGCPIITFGFGGTVVTSFPKQVPRYAAGQKNPMMKCSPGEVKLQTGKLLTLDESIATFPGPLKSKGKKKDILEWLAKKVLELEGHGVSNPHNVLPPDSLNCHEEKILLWRIVKVLVEHDGIIVGKSVAEKTVRALLSPGLSQDSSAPLPPANADAPLVGISRRGTSGIPDSVRPEAMEDLRAALIQGDREKAVWAAVDNRLWGHAMLLASTLDKTIWKTVVQEFVRQEVKGLVANTQSLSALYQVFAGNWEESMDELVPPSARAGLQMVSKTASTGPTRNALDGLDKWRETLTLILNNRTPDDGKAIISLGQLLASYGRTEAAHICYIFADTPGLFGGSDDPLVSVALLGSDHIRLPNDYGRNLDSVLLTEVYDFARTVLASSSALTVTPHLQSYKLYHAMILADHGYKSEAQQYCDSITSAVKSTTKSSPYYHGVLVGALENLQDRLRQTPSESSSSWISKGSIWAKFNSYVAGDESDVASTGSGKVPDADTGPFAKVAGDSPDLSRSPSTNDLYIPYQSGLAGTSAAAVTNTLNSRYAPSGVYTPRSSLEQPGRSSQEYSKPASGDSLRPSYLPQQYGSRPTSSAGSFNEPYKPASLPSNYPPRPGSYLPTPPAQPEYGPQAPHDEISSSSYQQETYRPTPPLEPIPSPEQYQPLLSRQSTDLPKRPSSYEPSSHEPPSSSYEPSASTYGPPSSHEPHSSSLEPLSYEPQSTSGYGYPSYQPSPSSHEPPSSSYEPPSSSYEPPSSSYEPPSSSYEPPSSSGYEPPSYNTEIPETQESPVEEKPKKKSFMDLDEDDDSEARAAALRKKETARKDHEADEVFRKAAEADAQKDKPPTLKSKKSAWFGGWLGGSKEKSDSPAPNAPIKAKLGEESSFYYDDQLKKWVNRKGPAPEAAAGAPPPPPRGPLSRAVSAAASSSTPPPSSTTPAPPMPMPIPMTTIPTPPVSIAGLPTISTPPGPSAASPYPASNMPSRTASPAETPIGTSNDDLQQRSTSLSALGGPPSAPPSRPPTGMSGASSIDDLIGAPTARKGGTVRKGKKGRGYVDVMAK